MTRWTRTAGWIGILAFAPLVASAQESALDTVPRQANTRVRFASYNVALNRPQAGALTQELAAGMSQQAQQVAEVIQRVRPDVLLLCEVDRDEQGDSLKAFCDQYLAVGQNGAEPIRYQYRYQAPVNTGVDSGIDLDGDGQLATPNDAYGYGAFPGQYGMAVLSQHEIVTDEIRTFQKFRWQEMPNALWPVKETGGDFYPPAAGKVFRLSSKSHWDVPIRVAERRIHFLVCHPTPPVFDGPEDRNGKRNHDEIRLWADYIAGRADYLVDDQGRSGGLAAEQDFVIAGDLNADPVDGDSVDGAMAQLLDSPLVQAQPVPGSTGGPHDANVQAGANQNQKGDPAHDTGDFNDRNTGNLRIDYCLPSRTLRLLGNGVYWPLPEQPGGAAVKGSDHRLVWIDLGW